MNTKTKEVASNKGSPYFLRVPWNKGGLVNTGPDHKYYSVQWQEQTEKSNKNKKY